MAYVTLYVTPKDCRLDENRTDCAVRQPGPYSSRDRQTSAGQASPSEAVQADRKKVAAAASV